MVTQTFSNSDISKGDLKNFNYTLDKLCFLIKKKNNIKKYITEAYTVHFKNL